MNRILNKSFGCALALTMLGGCATRSDFTAITTKNINISSIKVDKKLSAGQTKGEICQHIIFFIPTSGIPTPKDAIDRALQSKQSNLLLDAVLRHQWFAIPLIYGQDCWTAEGEAYDTFK